MLIKQVTGINRERDVAISARVKTSRSAVIGGSFASLGVLVSK